MTKTRKEVRRTIAKALARGTLYGFAAFYDEADEVIDALVEAGHLKVKE